MAKAPADFLAFCKAARITLYDWQAAAFLPAVQRVKNRFRYRIAGVSVPRGNGKSYAGAVVGLWRLLFGAPPQDVLSCALDLDGAKIILDHAKQILRQCPDLARFVDVQTNSLIVPETNSRWTITSREHTASRGRHPTLVLYDEAGWVKDDELFSSLLAGQASVADPLLLMISTVGKRRSGPLWLIKTLAEGGDESVYWYHSPENQSPRVTQEFLERQRRILLPGQYAREHQNQWIDAADSFTGAAEVDAAMSHGWAQQYAGDSHTVYYGFVDIGTIHDPSVIGIGHQDGGVIYVDHLHTFQGSREEPVQLRAIEELLLDLSKRFTLAKVWIESWQGEGSVQNLGRLGLPAAIFRPSAKTNSEQWPILSQRLTARTLILPPHARLREELLNLSYEVTASGIRVTDRGKIHQDHAVTVRGLCAMMQKPGYDPNYMPQAHGRRVTADHFVTGLRQWWV